MSYDGIVMRAVALELQNILSGARVDKIYQPGKYEVILSLRQPGQSYRLMLSAAAQEAGVYLTTRTFVNPTEPPLFCMLLRKHLEGGRIASVAQRGLERILEITCDVLDDWGEPAQRRLIIEVMGKHSNIILLNPAENRILDAVHRVSFSVSRYRQVLPGLPYQAPPEQDKLIPWEASPEEFSAKLLSHPYSHTLYKALLSSFAGFGPLTVEEVIYRSGLSANLTLEYCGEYELSLLWRFFRQTAEDIRTGRFEPEIVRQDNKPLAFSALALTHFTAGTRQRYAGISETVDTYYGGKREVNLFTQKKNDLLQVIKKESERCEKKAGLQLETIHAAETSDHYRLWGELLTAQQHALQPGKTAEVLNFYAEKEEILTIPLREELTLLENAQSYFNKYRKAKNAAKKARPQYEETAAELSYLNSIAISVENVESVTELNEIREELIEAGYLKPAPPGKGKVKPQAAQASAPLRFLLEGWEIYAGRNNKQNDLLVTRLAKPEDTWLHTKDIPGSHVLIKNKQGEPVPDSILEKAALIAAYHSKARLSTHVPVDYTLRKYVWKIKGAKPGMVHYENQRTVFVTPDAETIRQLFTYVQQ
ncbi:MAG: NFACT RNA binding domain-containing protein [Clostridia bacterium]|jgi:predicted ribosome quality control (RQC) complex YloA/Tae2 family protein|nr:NFACT RNA binding domain-containing protein [Clostridia bacterium]